LLFTSSARLWQRLAAVSALAFLRQPGHALDCRVAALLAVTGYDRGQYVIVATAEEPYQAFVPAPQPPQPPLALVPHAPSLRGGEADAAIQRFCASRGRCGGRWQEEGTGLPRRLRLLAMTSGLAFAAFPTRR